MRSGSPAGWQALPRHRGERGARVLPQLGAETHRPSWSTRRGFPECALATPAFLCILGGAELPWGFRKGAASVGEKTWAACWARPRLPAARLSVGVARRSAGRCAGPGTCASASRAAAAQAVSRPWGRQRGWRGRFRCTLAWSPAPQHALLGALASHRGAFFGSPCLRAAEIHRCPSLAQREDDEVVSCATPGRPGVFYFTPRSTHFRIACGTARGKLCHISLAKATKRAFVWWQQLRQLRFRRKPTKSASTTNENSTAGL